jgi:glucose-6-phosphate 1-epimerase
MTDLKAYELPGRLTFDEGNGGLPRALVSTPWSRAEIYLQGAHVTGFQKTGEPPLLFLSGSAEFAQGKPIRGGVPVIFPWFGPREALPAHGFARTATWHVVESSVLDDGAVSLRLRLPGTGDCEVEFFVTVGETLIMELSVRNTADKEFAFETCLHSYFQISAIDAISISGLENGRYFDKVAGTTTVEGPAPLRIAGEVDRVYSGTSAAVEIRDPGFQRMIHVGKSGSRSTVVWNPWVEKSKSLSDFGDEDYRQMVCVESGNIGEDAVLLPPGEVARLTVTISSEAAL